MNQGTSLPSGHGPPLFLGYTFQAPHWVTETVDVVVVSVQLPTHVQL